MVKRIGVNIDVTNGNQHILSIEDVSFIQTKIVWSLRMSFRKRWSYKLINMPYQDIVAKCLQTHTAKNIISFHYSAISTICFLCCFKIHSCRMNCLPTKSFICSTGKLCRLCNSYYDTGRHILNNCNAMLQLITKRHGNIQDLISKCFSLINIIHNIIPNIDNLYTDIVIEWAELLLILQLR